MQIIFFDTLKAYLRFTEAGFTDEQAKSLVYCLVDALETRVAFGLGCDCDSGKPDNVGAEI